MSRHAYHRAARLPPDSSAGQWGESGASHLEADLVVALAGGAVGDVGGALGVRDLDLALGDARARHGGAEQVAALVQGVGLDALEDVVRQELRAQVLAVERVRARHARLLADLLDRAVVQHVVLRQVGDVRDHLEAALLGQEGQLRGGVKATAVRQHQLRLARVRLAELRLRHRAGHSAGAHGAGARRELERHRACAGAARQAAEAAAQHTCATSNETETDWLPR